MQKESFSFTVMTMNLRFGLAKDRENGWDLRQGAVQDLLGQIDADLIGFQEVNHFQTRFLAKVLAGYDHIGWHNPHLPWWQSNPIFFKKDWACLGHRHHFISPFPDILSKLEGSRWPRQCVAGWFETRGFQVLVANTHFDFDPRVQARSAGLVMDFLDRFPPGLPAVVTGDFNAGPKSSAARAFGAAGFQEVFQGREIGTYHGFTGKPDGPHIDWILFRGGICPERPRVVTQSFKGRYPSDHFPVVTGFCPSKEAL